IQDVVRRDDLSRVGAAAAAQRALTSFQHEIAAVPDAALLDNSAVFLDKALDAFLGWAGTFKRAGVSLDTNVLTATQVVDIEESVWSPRFGIKGKLDITAAMEVKQMPSSAIPHVPSSTTTSNSAITMT